MSDAPVIVEILQRLQAGAPATVVGVELAAGGYVVRWGIPGDKLVVEGPIHQVRALADYIEAAGILPGLVEMLREAAAACETARGPLH